MPRARKINTELLKDMILRYATEELNGDYSKLKCSGIGGYVRKHGFPDVSDKSIRDKPEIVKFLKDIKDGQLRECMTMVATVSTYVGMDVDEFIRKNDTPDKLKIALAHKDLFYKSLSHSCAIVSAENKQLMHEVEILKKKIQELEDSLSKDKKKSETIAQYKMEVQVYKEIVETYVYPNIANELLRKAGILTSTSGLVKTDEVEKNLVVVDTDLSEVKSNALIDVIKRIK